MDAKDPGLMGSGVSVGNTGADGKVSTEENFELDCYPYTFSPLLLFAEGDYFDKGYSNYNSVAQFFNPVLGGVVDMLSNVLFERKNMFYEPLLELITSQCMLVTCCIDAHFTAFQVLPNASCIYYDPLRSSLAYLTGDSFKRFAIFMMLKCSYADSQHIQDNKAHYTGNDSNPTRRMIYKTWEGINKVKMGQLGLKSKNLTLNLDRYMLVNAKSNPRTMSTQMTGNTCYFQTFLFALLCKAGLPVLADDCNSLDLQDEPKLAKATADVSRFLLEFFVSEEAETAEEAAAASKGGSERGESTEEGGKGGGTKSGGKRRVLRPLTNSNVLLDFFRFRNAPYYGAITDYLSAASSSSNGGNNGKAKVPHYEKQFEDTLSYFRATGTLHRFSRFRLEGAMASTPNSKALQLVASTEHAENKLGRAHYYKYRAANFMFGFNAGHMQKLKSFCEFNSLRKNQLLAFYGDLKPLVKGCADATSRMATNKYRDYYFMPQYEVGQPELVDLHAYTYAVDLCALGGDQPQSGSGSASSSGYAGYGSGLLASLPAALGGSPRGSGGEDGGSGGSSSGGGGNGAAQGGAGAAAGPPVDMRALVRAVNTVLAQHVFWSTQRPSDYEKFLKTKNFLGSKDFSFFVENFLSIDFLDRFAGLGFAEMNPKEKDINSLTQTVFYSTEMMQRQSYRMEHEFEKECISQMARSNLRKYGARFEGTQDLSQKYVVSVKIGQGVTYSKYNTLMHFLNVLECYWQNPDLSNIQIFGKDIRALLAICCQKVFFEPNHPGFYHYGPIEITGSTYRTETLDLAVASSVGDVLPSVSRDKRGKQHSLVVCDRVFEHAHLKGLLEKMLRRLTTDQGLTRVKTDNAVLNLALLSLLLDFGLFDEYAGCLNLPFLQSLKSTEGAGGDKKRQLQVEVSNLIQERDKKTGQGADSSFVTRLHVEELIFECSHKFMVNKHFNVRSKEFEVIQALQGDPQAHSYVLLVKCYMSLCQINKSVEVDYYKLKVGGEFKVVIPENFSQATGDYLDATTRRYTFSERQGFISYGAMPLFDLRAPQPEIHLYKVRLDSPPDQPQSMVKYIEVSNVLRHVDEDENKFLVFVADNVLQVQVHPKGEDSGSSSVSSSVSRGGGGGVSIRMNQVLVEVSCVFFNEAISFIPCFKYADGDDVILFASKNFHYLVDSGGQFCPDYYGMKHELIECITSVEVFVDLNDEHCFKDFKLSELLTESKTVLHAPDFLLQVPSRQHLINLLDLAIYLRNLSFFVLVLFYLRRCSVRLEFHEKDEKVTKITGPWKKAILYVLAAKGSKSKHYDEVFSKQFFDLKQHEDLPLKEFVDVLCENFCRYQRCTKVNSDSSAEKKTKCTIVPTEKQKLFLQRIIRSPECFHFSEVGSGKTKVILPLLCQTFLAGNKEADACLARGGSVLKRALVVLVPEHLVPDALAQVHRYCLNLNFREEYRVHDDIFALLHNDVTLDGGEKRIFVTSFNSFKKALTYDSICAKVWPHREKVLVVCDEVDDFLDSDKLVFNICSNKGNVFDRPTLDRYYHVSKAAYHYGRPLGQDLPSSLLPATPDDAMMDDDEGGGGDRDSRGVAGGGSGGGGAAASSPPPSAAAAEEAEAALKDASNPGYWKHLFEKFKAIHSEIQDASRSINKSFGIFNEHTLRHSCSSSSNGGGSSSGSNLSHDTEGYKSLIARPYESVNRAMPGSYYSDVERTIYLTYCVLLEDVSKYDALFQEERKFLTFEFWSIHVKGFVDFDDLVYGHDKLSELVEKYPEIKDGLTRFLYEIILRRMEIRDKSRSVNSVDVVFNFDMVGFTGTPFLDNYPTFAHLTRDRKKAMKADGIPDLIDRSFYCYASEGLSDEQFKDRFAKFQGQNKDVRVEYVASDGIIVAAVAASRNEDAAASGGGSGIGGGSAGVNAELAILHNIFQREAQASTTTAMMTRTTATTEGAERDGKVSPPKAIVAISGGAGAAASGRHPSCDDDGEIDSIFAPLEEGSQSSSLSLPPPLSSPHLSLASVAPPSAANSCGQPSSSYSSFGEFNVLVDLCGVFKRSGVREVRDALLRWHSSNQQSSSSSSSGQSSSSDHTPCRFEYIYHVDQADGGDRVLCVESDSDVPFDEEFYKYMCEKHGKRLRDKLFFFVDNRNVIGKDVPFQLAHLEKFGEPLFAKLAVLAHDVGDFSKVWQAMGRSRTMNHTTFSVYVKGGLIASAASAASASGSAVAGGGAPDDDLAADFAADFADDTTENATADKATTTSKFEEGEDGGGVRDIKTHDLTRWLYVRNCDAKVAGNLSSMYQTLVSLYNLARGSFYHRDEIVNTFLEKMEGTIGGKVRLHDQRLAKAVLGNEEDPLPALILAQILAAKFSKSCVPVVAAAAQSLRSAVSSSSSAFGAAAMVAAKGASAVTRTSTSAAWLPRELLRNVVEQKFEQRVASGDEFDQYLLFLSGEQQSLMEISYSKQQQKQKQTQRNRNQDSDTMDCFQKKHQISLTETVDNYFQHTKDGSTATDFAKTALNLPLAVPVFALTYSLGGEKHTIRVYPTVQFLYSHHLHEEYVNEEVRELLRLYKDPKSFAASFLAQVSSKDDESPADLEKMRNSSAFSVGSEVVLGGIAEGKFARFNGQRGRILGDKNEKGNWEIEFHSKENSLFVSEEYLSTVEAAAKEDGAAASAEAKKSDEGAPAAGGVSDVDIVVNHVRQNPQYSLAALRKGVYVLGMKDQFNIHDLETNPLRGEVQYIADEMGFILMDKTTEKQPQQQAGSSRPSVDDFGPYFIEQYVLMEALSKQEVAQNVLDYYADHKEKLQQGIEQYDETQGKGFVCWRFVMN